MRIAAWCTALVLLPALGCDKGWTDQQCTPELSMKSFFQSGVLTCDSGGRIVVSKSPNQMAHCECPSIDSDKDGGK